jgi:NADPH:quinone reductase-like Zn-dependent oxidoreductase
VNGGSGGVGTHAIQIARALGARVVSVSSAPNLELCRQLGAAKALDYARDDPFAAPDSYRAVFDTVGSTRFARARGALDRRGTFIAAVPSLRILLDTLRTPLGYPRARLVRVASRAGDLATIAGLVEAGQLRAVIDRVFPLEEIAAACAHVETRRARGKVVLRLA